MTAPPPVSEASTTTPSAQTPRRPALRVPRVLRVTTEWWTTALPSSTDLQESTPCDGQGAGEGVGGRSADPRGLHGGSGSVPPAAPLQATPSLQSGEAELAAGVPHLPPPASERSLGSSAPGPQDEEGPGSPAPRSSGLQPTGWWVSFPFTCLCTNFCSTTQAQPQACSSLGWQKESSLLIWTRVLGRSGRSTDHSRRRDPGCLCVFLCPGVRDPLSKDEPRRPPQTKAAACP